jgi:cation transport ATPase
MTCATCVETNEAALRALPGVLEATVNLGAEKAWVTYIPSKVTVADMRRAIEEAGYQYLGIAGEVSDEAEKLARERDLHDKFMRFVIGFAVSIPLMVAMYVPLPVPMHTLSYVMLVISIPVFVYVSVPDLPGGTAAFEFRCQPTQNLKHALLRNAGIAVNKTFIKVAQNNAEVEQHVFRDRVLTVISSVEQAYWELSLQTRT